MCYFLAFLAAIVGYPTWEFCRDMVRICMSVVDGVLVLVCDVGNCGGGSGCGYLGRFSFDDDDDDDGVGVCIGVCDVSFLFTCLMV